MKKPTRPSTLPRESDIRDYAYHLYEQSNHAPGHDLENWLEATACLSANVPPHRSSSRLHWLLNGPQDSDRAVLALLSQPDRGITPDIPDSAL